jgi:hypothetical protein
LVPAASVVLAIAATAVVSASTPRPALTAEEREMLLAPLASPPPVSSTPPTSGAGADAGVATTAAPVARGLVEAEVDNALVVATGDRRLLVIGDSVPYLLADEWDALSADTGVSVVVRAAVGCRQSPDERDQGRSDTAAVCAGMVANLRRDLQQFRPPALLYHYAMADQFVRDGGVTYSSCSTEGRATLTEQVESMVDAARDAGAVMFLAMPNDPPDDLGLDPDGERLVGADCYRETYTEIAERNGDVVRLLRLDDLVCPPPDSGCREHDALRYDGIHFTEEGARIVLPWILERVFAAA